MQIMLVLVLVAAFTALNLLTGIILLPWRKTRPFGLYALFVEPGGVAGLVVAGFLWTEFRPLIQPYQLADWLGWALMALALLWLGVGAAIGAISGFALATWLWWRFSPEPYRSKIVNGYRRFLNMAPFHRQRWKQRSQPHSALPFDPE